MSMSEILTLVGVVLLGAVGAVIGGTLADVVRALADPKQRTAIRNRSFRENIRHILF